MSRVACVWVPFFAAAAAERCEPALVERPLAIVRGAPPVARVIEANAAAREHGVRPGMTEAEARARCPELARRPASDAGTVSAQHALLEAALGVSPRVEDAGPGLVYVDASGLARLIGDAQAIGERLVRRVRVVGMAARVGVAGSRTAARVAARTSRRLTVVAPGEEPAVLAAAPLAVLDLSEAVAAALARWGVSTLGELRALPRDALVERLGPIGLRAHDQALGLDREPFRPWTPPPHWEEAQGLDWEITELGPLVPVLGRVLERLVARLAAAHVAADTLGIHLRLSTGARDERTIALTHPTREVALMLALARLELDARPPGAPVTDVTVSARPVLGRAGQRRLWSPPVPVHRDLEAVLARLVELVGSDGLGSPALLDSHRPDAFTMAPFAPSDAQGDDGVDPPPSGRLVVRRLRPPRPIGVAAARGRPTEVRWGERLARVTACAGPWRVSGEWWDVRAWAREEWDVLLGDGTLCRIARDRVTGAWTLDAIYD